MYSLAQSCQSIYLSQLCGQIVWIANGYVAMGSFLTETSDLSKRLWFHQGGMSRSTGGGWDDATKHQGRRCHKISQEPWHAPAALMAKPDVTRQAAWKAGEEPLGPNGVEIGLKRKVTLTNSSD